MEWLGQWLSGWKPGAPENTADRDERVQAVEARVDGLEGRVDELEHGRVKAVDERR